jgi:cysteinyl-tRNA synthetase
VLWKQSKAGEPADTGWDSKYGRGRPGWHIECSAMGCTLLGERFDIHGGGQDLQFPHHENEIAQSEAATGQTFVNYWMHNGYVQIDNEKMSKSLNNFFTIREVLAQYDAEVVRFFIARAHYRSPLNYSDVHIDDARNALGRLYTALKDVTPDGAALDWNEMHAQRFQAAMNDDFNTPVAVSVLFELATEVNRTRDPALARQLRSLGAVLGLLGREPRAYLQQAAGAAVQGALEPAAIEAKIAERVAAKQAKDYAAADRIRAELLEAGVALEDKPGGLTEWRRV